MDPIFDFGGSPAGPRAIDPAGSAVGGIAIQSDDPTATALDMMKMFNSLGHNCALFVYLDGCPFCEKFVAAWNGATQSNAPVVWLHCTIESMESARRHIDQSITFPTLVANGFVHEFEAEAAGSKAPTSGLSAKGVVDFATRDATQMKTARIWRQSGREEGEEEGEDEYEEGEDEYEEGEEEGEEGEDEDEEGEDGEEYIDLLSQHSDESSEDADDVLSTTSESSDASSQQSSCGGDGDASTDELVEDAAHSGLMNETFVDGDGDVFESDGFQFTAPPDSVERAHASSPVVVLHYWNSCGGCKAFRNEWNSVVQMAAEDAPHVLFCALDIEKEPERFQRTGQSSVPLVEHYKARGKPSRTAGYKTAGDLWEWIMHDDPKVTR